MEIIKNLIALSQKKINAAESKRKTIFNNPILINIINDESIDEKKLMKILKIKSRATLKTAIYRLETDLILQLFDTLHYDQDLDERLQSSATVTKLIAVSLSLLKEGKRDLSIHVIKKAYYYAKKHGFFDLTIMCLQRLCFYYSMNQLDEKKYSEYSKELEYYNNVQHAEVKIELDYTYVTSILLRFSGKINNKFVKEIADAVHRMTEITNKYPTIRNILYTYDAQFGYLSQKGDFFKVIEHSLTFDELLQSRYPEEKLHKFTVRKNLALAYIQIGQYEEAAKYLEECLLIVTPGWKYWIYITSYHFITLIRSNRLKEAIDLTIQVINTKTKEKLNVFEEAWKIRIAFIHLLIESEFVQLNNDQRKQLKSFSISKFVNEVPLYSKDKLGQNINILFLQIGFLLLNRKYSKIIDRSDALQQYSYRYIKKSKYARAHCFVNLILTVIKANFHPTRTRNMCAPLIKKLDSLVLVIDENEPQYEIIPYNLLWDLFLHIIDLNAKVESN